MDYLKKLDELTAALPELKDLVKNDRSNHSKYMMEGGTGEGYGLLKNDVVGVQYAFLSKGSKFPRHTHEGWECLVIIKGKCKLLFDSTVREVDAPYAISFKNKVGHALECLTDVELVGIVTGPVDDTYPEHKGEPLNGRGQ